MMNSYIDVGIARPPGVKAQDIATLVRMSLYTVNAMRICIKERIINGHKLF